jgi:hypothetical protein
VILVKKLPLGIQNLREIIEGDYVYVDKTRFVYNLITDAKYYFLSRPRRFGKSLLLDTISEVMSGNKEMFKGLFIYSSDYKFEQHPVVRLDMSNIANETPDSLKESLCNELMKRIMNEGFDIVSQIPSDLFKNLIEALYRKYNKRVVVLIDEYDKPILDCLYNIEVAEANRQVLKRFYGILKSMDPYLKIAFITGVSKFTKTSIFSELNNLYDITLTAKYANICGIPIEDLSKYFSAHIENLAPLEEFEGYDDIHSEILAWYDGYSWDGKTRVINPFSLLSFFMQKRFASFWYASGTPKFLVDLIKKDPSIYINLKKLRVTELMLDTAELENIEAELLLFQSGYLTVKEVQHTRGSAIYLLNMPNFEVREAFNLHVLTALTGGKQSSVKNTQLEINEALQSGDLHRMLEKVRSLFASIPYQLHINMEAYYHSIFLAIMNVLGFDADAEVSVSGGRVDAVLELNDKIYIIEFKYDDCPLDAADDVKQKLFEKSLSEGMRQIKSKGYYKKYAGIGKTIYLAAFAVLGRGDIELETEKLCSAGNHSL